MKDWATKENYEKSQGDPTKLCVCYSIRGVWIKEDLLHIWRCAECFRPSLSPVLEVEKRVPDPWPPPYDEVDWSECIDKTK